MDTKQTEIPAVSMPSEELKNHWNNMNYNNKKTPLKRIETVKFQREQITLETAVIL